MSESFSAEIIPFPIRARATAAATENTPAEIAPAYAPAASADRLGTALAGLSTALTEQQEAIQRWRQAMADLSACMQKLNGGLDRLNVARPHAS